MEHWNLSLEVSIDGSSLVTEEAVRHVERLLSEGITSASFTKDSSGTKYSIKYELMQIYKDNF